MPMSAAVSCHGAFRTPQTSPTVPQRSMSSDDTTATSTKTHATLHVYLSPLLGPHDDVTLRLTFDPEKQPLLQRRVSTELLAQTFV